MRVRFSILLLFIACISLQLMEAQTEQSMQRKAKGKFVNPDELVSFKSDVPYSKAVQSLGELSKKLDGRLVIDRSPMQGKDKSIGVNIESMYWKDALELILRSNQLWYTEYPEYVEINTFEEVGKKQGEQAQKEGTSREIATSPSGTPLPAGVPPPRLNVLVDSSEYYSKVHDVSISCIFFDLNKTKQAESGVSFSIFRGRDLNLAVDFTGSTSVSRKVFTASAQPTGGDMPVSLYAALSMFESDQLGEVIARPQIVVRTGQSTQFQIGQDFSVLEKDFSGNTVQRFYPTGTILTVKPVIYKIGEVDFVDVVYKVEKSTFEASTITTVINKTTASGSLILLNGEEGYIGGMYSNEETTIREGVPLLKDLPWWVFGLRYLFGYDSKKVTKRELIVLLKAEILPSVEERATKQPTVKNIIKDSMQEMDKDIKRRVDK